MHKRDEIGKEKQNDILYIGMALIDSIVRGFDPKPVSASGYRAEAGSMHAGGEAVNGSIAAAKLGLNSSIMCHSGNDVAGDIVVSTLEKYGVDVKNILKTDANETPITTMLVETDGSRKSVTNRAHAFNFHPEKYLQNLRDKKIICLSSIFRAPFDDQDIIFKIVKTAKENGSIVFADTKIPNFSNIRLQDIKESLPFIDYIFPNDDEAAFFTEKTDVNDMADVFLDMGVKNVLIKRGAEGSLFKNSEGTITTKAFPVDVKDTTGAGDNFIAGFAAELLRGACIEKALRFANACGAVSAMVEGAIDGLKSREQVEGFIESSEIK